MNRFLKVKICSLAAEGRIIREQQNQLTRFNKLKPKEPIKGETMEQVVARRLQKKLWKAKCAVVKQKPLWNNLRTHRVTVVRKEARCSLIAYAFLRDKDYSRVEQRVHVDPQTGKENPPRGKIFYPDFKRVEDIVMRFTTEIDKRIVAQKFEQWVQNGKQNQSRNLGKQKAA